MAFASASKNCPSTVTALNPFLDRMYADSSEFTRIIFPKIKFFRATSFSSHFIKSDNTPIIPCSCGKEIFEFAFQKCCASPGESIMIGDSIEVDIKGAINAGIDQVYVNHLRIEFPGAAGIKPTYTVNSLKELEKIF